ncbi:glucosamine 6-phosphate synthetase [Solibacillus sp. CAU 1738]|uniref:glucosamine 6-phosphate synthetase n=1 Tax=Solibacillus sp. CAU 1738 TaxID=3140363 RepID=UPI00325FFE17
MKPSKRTILWIIPFIILGIFVYFYGPKKDITENEYIQYIKQVSLVENSNLSAEQTLGNFCKNGKWVYFQTQKRLHVVEFKGECPVDNVVQPINLQFVVEEDRSSYEVGVLLLNHVQQTPEERTKYIEQVYND